MGSESGEAYADNIRWTDLIFLQVALYHLSKVLTWWKSQS